VIAEDKEVAEKVLDAAGVLVMDGSTECARIRKICRTVKGDLYPPREVANIFEHLRDDFEIRDSGIKGAGQGLYVGEKMKTKGQVVGVYEGLVVAEKDGGYILEIGSGKERRWVDAGSSKLARTSIFGKMNEDLHTGRYNAQIGEEGFITMLEDCRNTELFTKYGKEYNWDALKTTSFDDLREELMVLFPGKVNLVARRWGDIITSSDQLNVWAKKVIEGRCDNNEMHGIRSWEDGGGQGGREDEGDRMVAFLTFGPNCRRFDYRHHGQEEEVESGNSGSLTRTNPYMYIQMRVM
jgi:hypothetical protein